MSQEKRAKVLIIDDVPENIHVLMALLKDEFAIIAATSGENGLQMAVLEPRPDIILLDIMMPDISGYEVCASLKENEATRDIPVIFISALSQEEDEARGLALGAVDYIHKPIRPTIVKARLRSHLDLARGRKKLQEQNQVLVEAARLREDVERIMRHDLKTPLNAIIGFPKILKEDEEVSVDDRNRMLGYIEEAGYIMLEMINMSLNLYKMETGSYELQPEPFDLVAVLSEVGGDSQITAGIGQTAFRVVVAGSEVASSPVFVLGERLLCYSMLANLVKNALEASPADMPVTVELGEVGAKVELSIHNYGAVPEDVRPNFFDKYATFGKNAGTGLGTYSARLIARMHGGEIELDTSVEGETKVCMQLPGVKPAD